MIEKHYESVIILSPLMSGTETEDTIKKFEKIITDNSGKIVHSDTWGLRELAYPIKKKASGFYHCVEFTGEGETITQLETSIKRDENVLRFLTVALDKHAIGYNDRKRNGLLTKKNKETIES